MSLENGRRKQKQWEEEEKKLAKAGEGDPVVLKDSETRL
jgi:hypothetical protein